MFTVTHFGIEKQFSSILQAMRYCRKCWRQNVRAVIWTDRPIFSSDEFKHKKRKPW